MLSCFFPVSSSAFHFVSLIFNECFVWGRCGQKWLLARKKNFPVLNICLDPAFFFFFVTILQLKIYNFTCYVSKVWPACKSIMSQAITSIKSKQRKKQHIFRDPAMKKNKCCRGTGSRFTLSFKIYAEALTRHIMFPLCRWMPSHKTCNRCLKLPYLLYH